MNKIEHEGIGAFARTEISQDENNADQKVEYSLKLLWEAYFQLSFFLCQYFIHVHILQIFRFSPSLKMRVKLRNG